MRILVISGSPRGLSKVAGHESKFIDIPRPGGAVEPVPVDSCSLRLANAFVEGASEAGHECVLKSLHELRHVAPCRACYGCLRTRRCVVQDDMQELYAELDRADGVVFVSPLYYATIPAQVLAIVNRLYPYWIDDIRYPKLRAAGVIGVSADFGQKWDLYDATWRSIFGEIGWPLAGIRHAPRFMEHADEYLADAKAFGRGFGDFGDAGAK